MKTLRRLRPKISINNDFYVFDTETGYIRDGKIHYKLMARPEAFLFGCVYGKDYKKTIYTIEDFHKEFLKPRYKDKYVFAHNAEYDLTVLYDNIYKFDPNAIFNGKFIAASNGNCRFANSLNIYNYSVKKIGEKLGLLKGELGNSKMVSKLQDGNIPDKDIQYCMRDCEIVYRALFEIFEHSNGIKITQASLSMNYYRSFFQPYDISHNQHTKHFWNSYYGGRTECFKMGKTNSSVFDINSSYPNAMKKCIFPNPRTNRHFLDVPVNKLLRWISNFEGCAYVELEHDDYWLGFLPYRHKGKLFFPTGRFSGWYNFNELRYALSKNVIKILHCYEAVKAERMESPFIDFVDTLYTERFASDNEMEIERIKIFLNSLYGKFAQRISKETIYVEDYTKAGDLINEYKQKRLLIKIMLFNDERLDAFLVVKTPKKMSLSYSIPSFSSYITSFARIELLAKLLECKANRPVYCDTDSIFVENDFDIDTGSGLGEWSREEKTITYIAGLKNYEYITNGEAKRRLKGVPLTAIQTGTNTYEYDNLMRTKESLRRNMEAGIPIHRVKEIKNTYTKRVVFSDGSTKPIKL